MMRAAPAIVLLMWPAAPVGAGFDEGLPAYMSADFRAARREWRPLAEARRLAREWTPRSE